MAKQKKQTFKHPARVVFISHCAIVCFCDILSNFEAENNIYDKKILVGKDIDIIDIARLVEWDETSFHWLYREYYKSLVAYAMSFLKDMLRAEDIVEELFVHLYDTRQTFMSFNALRNYLYGSVYHRCIDDLRHREIVNNFVQEATSHGETLTEEDDDASFREEFYRRLFKVIDEMPPRQRAVFVATMNGKSNKEIAHDLGISIDTVKTQKKRGMKALREDMKDGRFANALNAMLLFITI